MINVGKYRVHGAYQYGLCKRTRVNDCYKVQGCESFETFEEWTKPLKIRHSWNNLEIPLNKMYDRSLSWYNFIKLVDK